MRRETGVDAVGLDTTADPALAAELVPAPVALQGNLDPLALLAGGAGMRAEARRVRAAFGRRAHIFNLGHGILPQTPPEHVAELVRIVPRWLTQQAGRVAIVLFNLGGPDRPEAVRPFLRNLFSDPAILRVPFFVRPFLARLIANRRAGAARARSTRSSAAARRCSS